MFDDWIYDEVRYSLEDREGNATNGLIGVYVPEVENQLFQRRTHICSTCNRETTVLSMPFALYFTTHSLILPFDVLYCLASSA